MYIMHPNYVFRYPFVSISAVNMFDYVLSPNKELELYPFHFTNSIEILIKAGKCPSKKKALPPTCGWVVYFYTPYLCGEVVQPFLFEHFSLGEDSTPPTLATK